MYLLNFLYIIYFIYPIWNQTNEIDIFYNLECINKYIYLYSTQRIYLFIYLDKQ